VVIRNHCRDKRNDEAPGDVRRRERDTERTRETRRG
jgi:hypothetical protein